MVTIQFEDHGQDFLKWTIDGSKVIDCQPFQFTVWGKCTVLTPESELIPGAYVLVRIPAGKEMIVKYPIESVTAGNAA